MITRPKQLHTALWDL